MFGYWISGPGNQCNFWRKWRNLEMVNIAILAFFLFPRHENSLSLLWHLRKKTHYSWILGKETPQPNNYWSLHSPTLNCLYIRYLMSKVEWKRGKYMNRGILRCQFWRFYLSNKTRGTLLPKLDQIRITRGKRLLQKNVFQIFSSFWVRVGGSISFNNLTFKDDPG